VSWGGQVTVAGTAGEKTCRGCPAERSDSSGSQGQQCWKPPKGHVGGGKWGAAPWA
jgi:hypothetical protein